MCPVEYSCQFKLSIGYIVVYYFIWDGLTLLPGRQALILVWVLRTFPHGSLVLALIPYGCTCNRRNHYSLFYVYFTDVGNASAFNFPLYKDAPLSTEASWYATYRYAVANKLSYQATAQLLELIQIHCPSPNSCPKSLYLLKKHLSRDHWKVSQYCSLCMDQVPTKQKVCSKRDCKKNGSQLCYFAVLPFEEHLKDMFAGTKCKYN